MADPLLVDSICLSIWYANVQRPRYLWSILKHLCHVMRKSSPDEYGCWISWNLAFEVFVLLDSLCRWWSCWPVPHKDVNAGLFGQHRRGFWSWLCCSLISVELNFFFFFLVSIMCKILLYWWGFWWEERQVRHGSSQRAYNLQKYSSSLYFWLTFSIWDNFVKFIKLFTDIFGNCAKSVHWTGEY